MLRSHQYHAAAHVETASGSMIEKPIKTLNVSFLKYSGETYLTSNLSALISSRASKNYDVRGRGKLNLIHFLRTKIHSGNLKNPPEAIDSRFD